MSDKAPSSRLDDWTETVLGKLGQVRDVARKVGAAAIIDGGDFFHLKSPSRNTHRLVNRVAEHHANYPCPVYCTPGNHDSVYGDYAFLGQQPLGTLYAAGVFKRLYDEHEAVFQQACLRDKPQGPLPQFKVRVVGIPYHGNKYDRERFHSIKKGDEDVLICVAHVLASEKGGTMFEGEDIVRYSDLLNTAPDVYCFGHWHKDQGVTELGGKKFINVGSLTRGALSQDEVQRRPACVVISMEPGLPITTEVVRLDVGLPEDVFDVEGRSRQVKRQVQMDSFVERIRETLAPTEEGVSTEDTIRAADGISQDIKERALHYLEQA